MAVQEIVHETATNGAAIIIWVAVATSAYFLKKFADDVERMRTTLEQVRRYVRLIGDQLGIEEPDA